MMTSDQVRIAFLADLRALLDKWGAEIEAEDHYVGYAECGEDIRMTVSIPAIRDGFDTLRDYTEIDLGKRMEHS